MFVEFPHVNVGHVLNEKIDCLCICLSIYLYVYVYIYLYLSISIYISVSVSVSVSVSLYIYIYIHIFSPILQRNQQFQAQKIVLVAPNQSGGTPLVIAFTRHEVNEGVVGEEVMLPLRLLTPSPSIYDLQMCQRNGRGACPQKDPKSKGC